MEKKMNKYIMFTVISAMFLIGAKYFGAVLIAAIIWVLWRLRKTIENRDKKRVCILVFGDIGRSPRMQYHALSFIKEGYYVDIIGYPGSKPIEELRTSAAVSIHYLQPLPDWQSQMPRLLGYIAKIGWQLVDFGRVLFHHNKFSYLMMQNPPAIPTMPACLLYCWISRTRFIIDWHNYACSIMAMTVGRGTLLVKVAMTIEGFLGALADTHFCVSNAMKKDLYTRWKIEANILHDRPPEQFRPIDLSEKHLLLSRLSETYEEFGNEEKSSSILTQCLPNGDIQLRTQRPALIVSSTSWTEDEDFSILLTALKQYESACSDGNHNLPNLICAITGKGPLKDFWTAIIKSKKWSHVKIVTPWLANEDYPKLLASADLGICLHTSSSGLDLPMKVVDMFGCGLPVCAYNFHCLNELVKHGENSLIFSNQNELTDQLISWFTDFPNNNQQIMKDQKFRQQLKDFQKLRWHTNWSTVVLPFFK